MLLFCYSISGKEHYLAIQKKNFLFNRFDGHAGSEYSYGKKWLTQTRYLTGPREWTQIGPLNMVQWSE